MTALCISSAQLIEGDPFRPASTDLILVHATLDVGHPLPDGWTVHTGNPTSSYLTRVAYRYQWIDEGHAPELPEESE